MRRPGRSNVWNNLKLLKWSWGRKWTRRTVWSNSMAYRGQHLDEWKIAMLWHAQASNWLKKWSGVPSVLGSEKYMHDSWIQNCVWYGKCKFGFMLNARSSIFEHTGPLLPFLPSDQQPEVLTAISCGTCCAAARNTGQWRWLWPSRLWPATSWRPPAGRTVRNMFDWGMAGRSWFTVLKRKVRDKQLSTHATINPNAVETRLSDCVAFCCSPSCIVPC